MKIGSILYTCPTCRAHLRQVDGIWVDALAEMERKAGVEVTGSWQGDDRSCWYWSLGRRKVVLQGRANEEGFPKTCPQCGAQVTWGGVWAQAA